MTNPLRETIETIDYIVGRVYTHPEYSACVGKEKRASLRVEAKRHSLALENRSIDKPKRSVDKIDETHKIEEDNFRRLSEAWDYMATHGADFYTLSVLGNIIDPEANPNRHFRRGSDLEVAGFVPPTSQELTFQIDSLVGFLSSTSLHPVIRAAEAHIELVRIHPYGDGNGRAARLLQNHCLEERGYPAAIIDGDERSLYQSLLYPVLEGRFNQETSPEMPGRSEDAFYSFIASKVLASVKDLKETLKAHRAYKIRMEGLKSPGVAHATAKILRGKNLTSDDGIKVNVRKARDAKKAVDLSVLGDISRDQIRKVIDPLSKSKRFKYELKEIGC